MAIANKLEPITTPVTPPDYIEHYLNRLPPGLRVLDVGCGRGDTVAWLLDRGVDAYGVEMSTDYLDSGRPYLLKQGHDVDRLRLVAPDGTYPFPDQHFNVVLSDQVIEHVADLERLVAEIGRVSAGAALGLHIFPAKWRPVEVHLGTPIAHWLPKGRVRTAAFRVALRLGLASGMYADQPHAQRVESFREFSESGTFYRSAREVQAAFERYGMLSSPVGDAQSKIAFHKPGIHPMLLPVAGGLYRGLFSVVLRTSKGAA